MSQPNQYAEVKRANPDDVKALFDAGYSRNEIASRLSVSTRQVDRVAADLGLTFNRELTRDAVAARVSRANEERIQLADDLRKVARLELDSIIEGDQTVVDRRQSATVIGIMVQRDLEIAQYIDSRFPDDDGRAEAKSVLGELFDSIRAVVPEDMREQSD